ncbi:uncharacterized protein LOC117329177 [Pecten maximus]|uniref:uncharacterized protein LOC117329177 n=1 Tax=Pecten maximus TaxID=6579 RepID=UPI00145849DE|nr:uncharacterized protein LOC117329177 [Pecten maximus]
MSSVTSGYTLMCCLCILLCSEANNEAVTLKQRHNMVFHPYVTANQRRKCQDWRGNYIPEFVKTTDDCPMDIDNVTVNRFAYDVIKNNYNFVNLYLQFFGDGDATYTSCVIEPQRWVWTFKGPMGALQYLKWPPEYSVWSIGLLMAFSKPTPYNLNISINSNKNCSVFVGKKNTTGRIGLALSKLSRALSQHGGILYESSYFCFKTRTFIDNEALYSLCLHMICPLEATGYICCHMEWNYTLNRSVLVCPAESFEYDAVWWIVPFVLGAVLFVYFPIVLFFCSAELRDKFVGDVKPHVSDSEEDETTPLLPTKVCSECDWSFTSPITVWTIISRPMCVLGRRFPTCFSRTMRLFFAVFSLSFIAIKIVVHYLYQYDFIVASVTQGTPMDFLSVLAGYEESKHNFLKCIGGPYIACGLYLLAMVILMCIPKDLSELMENGIPSYYSEGMSPLTMPKNIQYRLGSVNTHKNVTGYRLVYRTMTSNFFMLLNFDFWAFTYQLQFQRIIGLRRHRVIAALVFPLYVAFCILEICICVIYFGFPITLYIVVFLKSYISAVWRLLQQTISIWFRVPLLLVTMPAMLGMLLFVIYMFSIIFVGSFIFLSRVAIFTYTGLFAFPNYSYGYIIFSVTIIMYIRDVINHVGQVYRKLFQELTDLCRLYQMDNDDCPVQVFRVVDRVNYIPEKLFLQIASRYQPTRLEMIRAFSKILIVVFVLFISVYLIQTFQRFKELSILTQSVTTLFVCLLPKLCEGMCTRNATGFSKQWKAEVTQLIADYCSKSG